MQFSELWTRLLLTVGYWKNNKSRQLCNRKSVKRWLFKPVRSSTAEALKASEIMWTSMTPRPTRAKREVQTATWLWTTLPLHAQERICANLADVVSLVVYFVRLLHVDFRRMQKDIAEVKTTTQLIKSEFKGGLELINQRVGQLEVKVKQFETIFYNSIKYEKD